MGDNTSPTRAPGLRILSFNVAKSFVHMDTLLQTCRRKFDIIFFQEPSWRVIRMAPSTCMKDGEDVVGAPKHPDWLTIVRSSGHDDEVRPRIMAFVSNCLANLRPSYRRDLIDHHDILPISLFEEGRV